MDTNKHIIKYNTGDALSITGINENHFKEMFKQRGNRPPIINLNSSKKTIKGKRNKREFEFYELMFIELYKVYQGAALPPPFFQEFYNMVYSWKESIKPELNIFDVEFKKNSSNTNLLAKDISIFSKGHQKEITKHRKVTKENSVHKYETRPKFFYMSKESEVWLMYEIREHAISSTGNSFSDCMIWRTSCQPPGFRWKDKTSASKKKENVSKTVKKMKSVLQIDSRTIDFTEEFMDIFLSINLNNIREEFDQNYKRYYQTV
jgi:hypothetical protein